MPSSHPSPSMAELADVLDRAADHIETVGWFQGDLFDSDWDINRPMTECRVCALGAINVALHGSPYFPNEGLDAHDLADYVTNRRIEGYDLAAWNDQPGRTQEDVTTVLRETAAELRAAGAR